MQGSAARNGPRIGLTEAARTAPDETIQRTRVADRTAETNRQILAGIIAVVVGGVGVMVACGYYAFIFKKAIIPALVLAALLSRRLDRFVADWSIFLGLVILFDFLRGLVFAVVTHFDLPVYMHYAIEWERALCGGGVAPVIVQHWRAALDNPGFLDRLLTVVHASHFAYFLIFGLAVWMLRPAQFRRYALAVVLVLYVGEVFYLIVPTVPPWMAAQRFGVLPPLEHITAHMYNAELPTLQKAFDINPIAAMPSLHAALPTLCLLFALSQFGWWALPVAAYTALALFGIVYLAEHYLVDVLAGMALAAAAFAAVSVPWRAWLPRRAWFPWGAYRGWAHPIAITALLMLIAEGAALLTYRIGEPFEVSVAFAARELNGRTAEAQLYLGRLALHRGDLEEAREQFSRAVDMSESEEQRRDAALLLAQVSARGSRAGTRPAGVTSSEPDRVIR